MKVYTNEIDLAKPSVKQITTPSYSDFGLAIKILKDDDDFEAEFTLENDGQTITPEDNKIDGYTIYVLNSGEVGSTIYKVKCQGQSFDIVCVSRDESVFDKISYVTKTEYAIAIGSINSGVLTRNDTTNVVEVGDHALFRAFAGNTNIVNVSFPNMTDIDASGMKEAYSGCTSLKTVDFSKLSTVGTDGLNGTFNGCTSLEIVLFQSSTAVPAISDNTFANTNETFKVIVPDALYEDWIAAENWSDIASQITKVSDYAAVMTNYGGYNNMDDNN